MFEGCAEPSYKGFKRAKKQLIWVQRCNGIERFGDGAIVNDWDSGIGQHKG